MYEAVLIVVFENGPHRRSDGHLRPLIAQKVSEHPNAASARQSH
jgi:hypothetical protein